MTWTSEDQKKCLEGLKQASKNAINETFKQGRPISTVRGEFIVLLYQCGDYELVKHIGITSKKAEKKTYQL